MVAAANRARGLDMLLTRIAMHADEKNFAKVRQAFEGAPAKKPEAPQDDGHGEFLKQVRDHFAGGKS